MQRTENKLIVISCDFCGVDWDEVIPMVEGHHGSILCLDCLKLGLAKNAPQAEPFQCTLCLQHRIASTAAYRPSPLAPTANPNAYACISCIKQTARAFDKDPDIDWKWDKKIGG